MERTQQRRIILSLAYSYHCQNKIVKREGLLKLSDLEDFTTLTKLLQDKATEVEEEENWLAEIWDSVPVSRTSFALAKCGSLY